MVGLGADWGAGRKAILTISSCMPLEPPQLCPHCAGGLDVQVTSHACLTQPDQQHRAKPRVRPSVVLGLLYPSFVSSLVYTLLFSLGTETPWSQRPLRAAGDRQLLEGSPLLLSWERRCRGGEGKEGTEDKGHRDMRAEKPAEPGASWTPEGPWSLTVPDSPNRDLPDRTTGPSAHHPRGL